MQCLLLLVLLVAPSIPSLGDSQAAVADAVDPTVAPVQAADAEGQDPDALTVEEVEAAAKVLGLTFTAEELGPMVALLERERRSLESLRIPTNNAVPPALVFHPLVPPLVNRAEQPDPGAEARVLEPPPLRDSLAFAGIEELGAMLRSGRLSCVELTQWALEELGRVDATLHCSITLLPERALEQARSLDEELAAGRDRYDPFDAAGKFWVLGARFPAADAPVTLGPAELLVTPPGVDPPGLTRLHADPDGIAYWRTSGPDRR